MRTIFLLTITLIIQLAKIDAATIYIVPFSGINPNEFFFNPHATRDQCAKPFCMLVEALKSKGYAVKFTNNGKKLKDVSAIISFNNITRSLTKNLSLQSKKKCLLLVFEPPVVMPELYSHKVTKTFGKIFVMLDQYIYKSNYYKFNFPQPQLKMIDNIPKFEEKKFCALIAGNKSSNHPKELYSARKNTINYLTSTIGNEFDLFGPNWTGYAAWRGSVESKWETLKHYKFCICYENMKNQDGYITEKIFDCMVAGCIPIYWGADDIAEYVPEGCFVDRRKFQTEEQLLNFMKSMNENEYNTYLDSMRKYFDSDEAQEFSSETFVNLIVDHIEKL